LISIVLADDHHVVRQGLRALLEDVTDFEIIDEADEADKAVEIVKNKKPSVLILDLMMKGLNSLSIIRRIRNYSPETNIVILSMYDNESYIIEALRAGANSYVLKGSTAEELIRAVREVAAGHRYLGLPISERAISSFMQNADTSDFDLYETLTTREREVLHMVAQGYTNVEIAAQLYVSPRTVEVHRSNMMRKLRLKNHTQLVQFALERKILLTSDYPVPKVI
jgi:two-component system response regulator NreC